MKKETIPEVVFARFVCALCIVLYHFSCHSTSQFKVLYDTSNSGWGNIIVAAFFVISGIVLSHNYPLEGGWSVEQFYYRRWKSIFPMFYLCYFYFYITITFKRQHLLFSNIPARSFLLSILGLDGYFYYKSPNFYIIGEWFLGAIIILYLLYPLLTMFIRKTNWIAVFCCFLGLFAFVLYDEQYLHLFQISSTRNIISCLVSFLTGIFIGSKFSIINNNSIIFAISGLVFLLLYVIRVKNELLYTAVTLLQGYTFIIVLMRIGTVIMRSQPVNRIITRISSLTFPIFLFHHKIIEDVLSVYNPEKPVAVIALELLTILLTIVSADILAMVVKSITDSKAYQKIESKVLQ